MKNLFICIPDTNDSFEFLEAAEKYQLPLLLLIKKKWLKSIQPFSWDYLIIDDFGQMKNVVATIEEFLSRKFPDAKIIDCLAFGEAHVEVAGYLNTHFATDGLSRDQAALFRDKHLMKQQAQTLGLATPLFSSCDDRWGFYEELQKVCLQKKKSFTFLIKPKKSWACQGIQKFTSIEEAEKQIANFENAHDYLLEEYIEAEMFHVGGVVAQGRTILSVIVKHDASIFEMGRSSPEHLILHTIDQYSEEAVRLKKAHDLLVTGFGMKDGLTFIEFFQEPSSGQILLCEAAARLPALHVPKLYEIVSGKNFFKEFAYLLASKLKGDGSVHHPSLNHSYAGMISFAALPGKLVEVDSLDRFDQDEIVYKSQAQNQLGTIFENISFKNTIGQIIVKTSTERHCQDLLQTYCLAFRYQIETV